MAYKTSKTPYRQQRSNAKWAKIAALGLALFGLFCLVKVWQNVSVDQLSRRNEKIRKELALLHGKNSMLYIKQEQLLQIDNIEKIAHKDLRFDQAQIIRIPAIN
jgi:hypothetical protein